MARATTAGGAFAELPLVGGVSLPAGREPAVIVGANGTGKTRLGRRLVGNGAFWIRAQRPIDIPDVVPMRSKAEAVKLLETSDPYRISSESEMTKLLAVLLAEETEAALMLKDAMARKGFRAEGYSTLTRLDVCHGLWRQHFPSRELVIRQSRPTARLQGSEQQYDANDMSDGERQAVYLIAKVLLAPMDSVIVVDEPEIHLHPLLAQRLWDSLEQQRVDCRFIYITHDLVFAMNRHPSAFILCRDGKNPEVMNAVTTQVASDLIGAMALPAMLGELVFCEGKPQSLDAALFEAWFVDSAVAVRPAGSCDEVVKAVRGLRAIRETHAVAVTGIVDRDSRCSDEIDTLRREGIHVLNVYEVEALYCVPDVFCEVLRMTGVSDTSEHVVRLNSVRNALRKQCTNAAHRLVLSRAVDATRWANTFPLSELKPGRDHHQAQHALNSAVDRLFTNLDSAGAYAIAREEVEGALRAELGEALRILPGKKAFELAAAEAGVTKAVYARLVCRGLRGGLGAEAQDRLRRALNAYLPQVARRSKLGPA